MVFKDIAVVRDYLKSIIPLNELIEAVDGIKLERVHSNLYKRSCMFPEHPIGADGSRDSTPSFTVAPEKELFHCFGCGVHGDRFEYISRIYNCDHIESIEKVAQICGVDLTPYYAELTPEEEAQNALYHHNIEARNTAHAYLLSNERALGYLNKRGISLESIDDYQLGYAPPITSGQVTMFAHIEQYIQLQLLRHEQFNDAILFPVNDAYGRMRYFQSRPFTPPTPSMKYIGGSSTHPLFDNDDRVFGIDVARKKYRQCRANYMICVEGAPDAIMCTQSGLPAFALMGTALSIKTMALMEKYKVPEIVLLLDGDATGRDKSKKIAAEYTKMKTMVRLRIAMIPDGDPDEYINMYGVDALKKLISQSPNAIEYLIDSIWEEMRPEGLTQYITYLGRINEYIAPLSKNDIVRTLIVRYLADKLNLDAREIDLYLTASDTHKAPPPHSKEGEEIILGEALRNQDFASEVVTLLKPEDFYFPRHAALFDLICTSKATDFDSLVVTARNRGLDAINTSYNITRDWLASLIVRYGDINFALSDVRDKSMRRQVRSELWKLDTQLDDMTIPAEVIVDRKVTDIYNKTLTNSENAVITAKQQVAETMKIISERMQSNNRIIGFDLGPNFPVLTNTLLGVQTKKLIIISANQTVGKTQICQNLAMYLAVAAEQATNVLWFTFEMDSVQMTFRHLAILTGINHDALQTGDISMDEMTQRLIPAAAKLSASSFFISEQGVYINEALSIARKMVMKEKVKVIVVDYLQLQSVENFREKRYQELGTISKAWKQFSREMDVAVIGISQLSKEALREDVAKAEHGAGSYEIAQDADVYITLKDIPEEEIALRGIQQGNILMNVDKNRSGKRGVIIPIYSERDTQRMFEVNKT